MVAAALPSPQAGSMANMIMRTAIVYPAIAALPNDAMRRMSTIQLKLPTST